MISKPSLTLCYCNYSSSIISSVHAALKNKNAPPHMIPTQVAAHVTCRTADSVTTFICQKSHSSRVRSVILAAAETVSVSCLPVKAQLSVPQYQILLGHFRQLSTAWRLRTDRGWDGKSHYSGCLLFSVLSFNIYTKPGSPNCSFLCN